MSKITGVLDFKDFYDEYGSDFLKKLKIYKGYYNYVTDNPIDTSKYNDEKDWSYLFHHCVLSKSIYKNLNSGYIILCLRDFFSEQDDATASTGKNKRIEKQRIKFAEWLENIGFTHEDAMYITRYQSELEHLKEGVKNESE